MKRLLFPIALVLVANGLALINVSRNRSEVRNELELSERELWVQGESRDRSSISLHLTTSSRNKGPAWLDESKMMAIGFRPIRSKEDASQLPRRGFAVLEFDGPEYRHMLEEYEAEHRKMEIPSRLLIVDFAIDAKALEAKYPDRAHYLIVRATVFPTYYLMGNPSVPEARRGNISIDVPSIEVPNPFRSFFIGKERSGMKFQARIRFGANDEPWVASVSSLNP